MNMFKDSITEPIKHCLKRGERREEELEYNSEDHSLRQILSQKARPYMKNTIKEKGLDVWLKNLFKVHGTHVWNYHNELLHNINIY
jgi:excinuclease UvrABC helicase subunit UvrB